MELTTTRLLLRPFRADDLTDLHAVVADPEMSRWAPDPIPDTSVFLGYSLEYETEKPRRHWRFAVVRRADGKLIGSAELHIESPEHRRGAMGYLIAAAAQGQGYATEAAQAVLDFGLTGAGLHRITATCDPENAGSVRVLEKIGMTREGLLRDHYLIRGEWRDRVTFAKLAQLR
jgi:RimJ/RimL family protein N-acetyltransferase